MAKDETKTEKGKDEPPAGPYFPPLSEEQIASEKSYSQIEDERAAEPEDDGA
jgi:hypothetical protein